MTGEVACDIRHSQVLPFLQGVGGIGLNRILDIWKLLEGTKREIHTSDLLYQNSNTPFI